MNLMERYRELDPKARSRMAAVVIALLLLALCYSLLNDQITRLKKRRASRESAVTELMLLSHQFRLASSDAQRLNNRLAAVKADDTPAKLLDEIGIKGKGSQVKPVKGTDRQDLTEDAAEIKVEGLTANEAVNLVYRLEKGTRPVVIKRANLKTRYDDPTRLDVTLIVALLKPLPQERR